MVLFPVGVVVMIATMVNAMCQQEPIPMLHAGGSHTCAVTTDGNAVCWGCESFDDGQCIPPEITDLVKIEVGSNHSYAIDISGNSTCWGRNQFGESEIPDNITVEEFGLGHIHSCAVSTDNSLPAGGVMPDQKQIWVSVKFPILVAMLFKMLVEVRDTVVHWMKQVRYTAGGVVKIKAGIWVNVNLTKIMTHERHHKCVQQT